MTRFRSDDSIGLLLEPREDLEAGSLTGTDDPAVLATVAGIGRLNDLQADDDLETFAQRMGELLQELNGFDRVMVYRFDSDWNGTVIAEARQPQVEASYLGLTFPASDIPPQARQLFQQAAARPTIDVACDPQPLLYADGVSGPADLSHCSYRAVAPVHREYLGNMAVRASLTLALTVRGKLWGLVACHHLSGPRKVDPLQLALLRTLSEILSLALARVLERQEHGLLERVHQLGHWLQQRSSLSPRPDFQADVVRQLIRRLKPMLGCDSFVYRDGDQLYRSSGAPSAAAIETIAQFFGRWSREHAQPALVTAELQGYGLPLSAADARKAAGAVVLGDGRSTQQLMLFRLPAVVPSTWAGDPDGRVLQPEGSDRLDPRSSFELFLRENRTDAEAWPAGIVPSVDKLRAVLRQAHWITFSRIEAQERESLRLQAVAAEERMSHAALHDPLTGLPNRRFLQDRLQQLIARPREQAPAWALLHLDLDDFKAVNDNFGHDTGDQLLVKVAQILRQQVREQDLVIRLGGDEFVVLAQRLDGDDEEELPVLARRLIASVSRAHLIKEHICRIGLSIGIACCDADQLPVSALLNRSDLALYESKRRGKTCFSFYSEELDARLREEMLLLSELQDALEWDTSEQPQLDVYLQPQFSVADGALIGAEALLRWHHPRLGLLTPPAFLYVADKNRLMASLDAYVLKQIGRAHV